MVQKPSYYVRLGSLSTKLRSRAYQQALCRVEEAKRKGQETISQLHSAFNLVKDPLTISPQWPHLQTCSPHRAEMPALTVQTWSGHP